MPAPPARHRSASVPWGVNSRSSSPLKYILSKVLFSPTYEAIILLTCFDCSNCPNPPPSTPALLDTAVKPFFSGRSRRALMSESATPDRPNPPHKMVAPLGMSSMAASADGKTLFTSRRGVDEEKRRARRSVYQLSAPTLESPNYQLREILESEGVRADECYL